MPRAGEKKRDNPGSLPSPFWPALFSPQSSPHSPLSVGAALPLSLAEAEGCHQLWREARGEPRPCPRLLLLCSYAVLLFCSHLRDAHPQQMVLLQEGTASPICFMVF